MRRSTVLALLVALFLAGSPATALQASAHAPDSSAGLENGPEMDPNGFSAGIDGGPQRDLGGPATPASGSPAGAANGPEMDPDG
jgi:hypothetical protein